MNIKARLILMNFLQFAVWGAYLTSMGTYLAGIGLGNHIGIFYAMQGIVSLFMPAIMGIIADRWVPAQRLLGICHLLAALFMGGAGYYGTVSGNAVSFEVLFAFYSVSVAFYMPTLALSNSVAYSALDQQEGFQTQGFNKRFFLLATSACRTFRQRIGIKSQQDSPGSAGEELVGRSLESQ